MNVSLVMTVIGEDRPGLVDSLAKLIAEHDGNWLESRMSHLCGQFAGILRVEVAEAKAERLKDALMALEESGLRLVIASDSVAGAAAGSTRGMRLELMGQDRPGIVRDISQALADKEVNVEEFQTECVSAPMSGESLFKAEALLKIPEELSLEELKGELERIAADLMVDIVLERESG